MGWKIYFVALTIIVILSYVVIFSEEITAYDYIHIPVGIITLTGLFGYSFNKNIFISGFWKFWLFVEVIWGLVEIFLEFEQILYSTRQIIMSGTANFDPLIEIASSAIAFYIVLPSYIALYLYGFRSKDLWDRDKDLDLNKSGQVTD